MEYMSQGLIPIECSVMLVIDLTIILELKHGFLSLKISSI